jgi:hypothetical protein
MICIMEKQWMKLLIYKNVITYFEWKIIGRFHCDTLDIRIFTTSNSHLEQK